MDCRGPSEHAGIVARLVTDDVDAGVMLKQDVMWRPYGYYRTKSNVARFMDQYGYDAYEELLPDSEEDIARLWGEFDRDTGIVWDTDYETVLDTSEGAPFARWFGGGELNATRTLLDQWVDSEPDRTAYHWTGEQGDSESLTYAELAARVGVFANALRDHGIGSGDAVGIVAPLRPEPIVAALACLKIDAVYTDVFAGYGTSAIRERLSDCGAELVVTVDGYHRSGEVNELRAKVDESVADTDVRTIVTHEHLGLGTSVENAKSVSWTEFTA
ncbi:MAG: AMP-binding protein, partial [Halapricum sp.]